MERVFSEGSLEGSTKQEPYVMKVGAENPRSSLNLIHTMINRALLNISSVTHHGGWNPQGVPPRDPDCLPRLHRRPW